LQHISKNYKHKPIEIGTRSQTYWGRCGRDRMVVGFTVTCDRSVVFSGYSSLLHQ